MIKAYRVITLLFLFCIFSGFTTLQAQSKRDSIIMNKHLLKYAKVGQVDSVMNLIRKGADPGSTNSFGVSALMYATEAGHLDVVKVLLHNGADPNRQPKNGFTALMHACYTNQFEIAYTLARYGALLEVKDSYGATALHYATFSGNYDLVDMLLFYKANANAKASDGNTPLHVAMFIQDTSLCSILLYHGARIDERNAQGYTPLMLAAQENNIDVVDYLSSHKASLYAVRDSSHTALSYAAAFRNDTSFYYLLDKIRPEQFSTPLAHKAFLTSKHVQERPYSKALIEKGLQRSYMPALYGYSIQSGMQFNGSDFFFRHEVGLWEYRYNTKVALGFSHRAVRKPILLKMGEDVYYQVFEKKQLIDLTLQKRFQIIPDKGSPYGFGVYLEDRMQFAIGKYVGLDQKLDQRFFNTAAAGIYMFGEGFYMGLGYAYTAYNYIDISNHKIELHLAGVIPAKELPRKYYPNWL